MKEAATCLCCPRSAATGDTHCEACRQETERIRRIAWGWPDSLSGDQARDVVIGVDPAAPGRAAEMIACVQDGLYLFTGTAEPPNETVKQLLDALKAYSPRLHPLIQQTDPGFCSLNDTRRGVVVFIHESGLWVRIEERLYAQLHDNEPLCGIVAHAINGALAKGRTGLHELAVGSGGTIHAWLTPVVATEQHQPAADADWLKCNVRAIEAGEALPDVRRAKREVEKRAQKIAKAAGERGDNRTTERAIQVLDHVRGEE